MNSTGQEGDFGRVTERNPTGREDEIAEDQRGEDER